MYDVERCRLDMPLMVMGRDIAGGNEDSVKIDKNTQNGPTNMAKLAGSWIVLLALCAGCVRVSSSVLIDRSASPVPQAEVYVFLPGDEIPESCERVAIVHASGNQDLTNEGQMLDKLREEVGKLGANAVEVRTMEDAGTGERVVAALFGTEADRDSDALALYCPDGTR